MKENTQTFSDPNTIDMEEMHRIMVELEKNKPSPPIRLIPDVNLVVPEIKQVKFPKSKRKRIVKKWSKNRKNFGTMLVPIKIVFKHKNGDLRAHPEMIKSIRWCLKNDLSSTIKVIDVYEPDFSKLPEFEFPELKPPLLSYGYQPLLRDPIKLINVTA